MTNNDAATYLLTVSNTQGTVSGSASLTVIPFAAPVITAQPNDLNLSSGYFGQTNWSFIYHQKYTDRWCNYKCLWYCFKTIT
mgnify:CR=1 FL=1